MNIGFWGIGNMGGSLMKGYADAHGSESIYAFDLDKAKLSEAKDIYDINICDSLEALVSDSDLILIALKPNLYEAVLPELSKFIKNEIVVSVAAGISIRFMESILGNDAKIVRTMPNTPALVGEGMTAISRNKNITDNDLSNVKELFSSVGKAEEVSEDMIDTVIGVSGSSPAYAYMYIEALANGAVKNGMTREDAIKFAAQSTLGAAKMVLETGEDPKILRDNVCSPNGTTIEAVQALQKNGFEKNIIEGMEAAISRSKELTK